MALLDAEQATHDPRVRIGRWGKANWRTLVEDELTGWYVTGPSYPTKAEAFANVETAIKGNY